jgi:hypothetical protein
MTEPIAIAPKTGWQPTTSTSTGALLGGAIAQLICAGLTDLAHLTLSPQTICSITTVCVFAAGYVFPDGGRK